MTISKNKSIFPSMSIILLFILFLGFGDWISKKFIICRNYFLPVYKENEDLKKINVETKEKVEKLEKINVETKGKLEKFEKLETYNVEETQEKLETIEKLEKFEILKAYNTELQDAFKDYQFNLFIEKTLELCKIAWFSQKIKDLPEISKGYAQTFHGTMNIDKKHTDIFIDIVKQSKYNIKEVISTAVRHNVEPISLGNELNQPHNITNPGVKILWDYIKEKKEINLSQAKDASNASFDKLEGKINGLNDVCKSVIYDESEDLNLKNSLNFYETEPLILHPGYQYLHDLDSILVALDKVEPHLINLFIFVVLSYSSYLLLKQLMCRVYSLLYGMRNKYKSSIPKNKSISLSMKIMIMINSFKSSGFIILLLFLLSLFFGDWISKKFIICRNYFLPVYKENENLKKINAETKEELRNVHKENDDLRNVHKENDDLKKTDMEIGETGQNLKTYCVELQQDFREYQEALFRQEGLEFCKAAWFSQQVKDMPEIAGKYSQTFHQTNNTNKYEVKARFFTEFIKKQDLNVNEVMNLAVSKQIEPTILATELNKSENIINPAVQILWNFIKEKKKENLSMAKKENNDSLSKVEEKINGLDQFYKSVIYDESENLNLKNSSNSYEVEPLILHPGYQYQHDLDLILVALDKVEPHLINLFIFIILLYVFYLLLRILVSRLYVLFNRLFLMLKKKLFTDSNKKHKK